MRNLWLYLILALVLTTAASDSEKSIRLPEDNALATLRPGPGVKVVRANCAPCHSTDYIVRQPGSDPKHWEAEVKKMITVFGAPISDADAKVIVDYLSGAYGPEVKPEPTAPEKQKTAGKRQ